MTKRMGHGAFVDLIESQVSKSRSFDKLRTGSGASGMRLLDAQYS
jgi:hypothetical protein